VELLTPREEEVLGLICDGCSTKEIAANLKIAYKTAACHRNRILEKAGVHNAVALLLWAIKHGYIEIDLPPMRLGARRLRRVCSS
jgi:DNA-binding CsgD family transcriptional regulator